ncbi:MAG: hypothetical protein NZ772_11695 [Cyanobacteria bacterium]|nr:hypothetical protein [Cyanobacteriota bacterium]MDW8202084.1 hypothetical protein [Cyanobacteriota bacterium SKYGB_h_bin112]
MLTMRDWAKATLEEERQHHLELTAELEKCQTKIAWLEQVLATTEKILPDASSSGQSRDLNATLAASTSSQKSLSQKVPQAAKSIAKSPTTKPSTSKVTKYVPSPQPKAKSAQSSVKKQSKKTTSADKRSPVTVVRKFSIKNVPFLPPYKGQPSVVKAIKAFLDDHPNEAMDIDQIIEGLFGKVPANIQEQVRHRVTTDLSKGKNTLWQSVPGRRGYYQTLSK